MSHVKGFCCLYFLKCKPDYFIANLKINDFILIAKHFGDLVPPCGDFWCPEETVTQFDLVGSRGPVGMLSRRQKGQATDPCGCDFKSNLETFL